MSNPSRRKGTSAEVQVVSYFRRNGLEAERLRQAGPKDEGDIVVRIGGRPFVIEAKATKAFTPSTWVEEAEIEAVNYALGRALTEPPHHLVIAKRRGTLDVARWYAIMPVDEWLSQVEVPF